ncbi:hypothetical protein Droror1_Dr00011162 [Drosera rotundifolia]
MWKTRKTRKKNYRDRLITVNIQVLTHSKEELGAAMPKKEFKVTDMQLILHAQNVSERNAALRQTPNPAMSANRQSVATTNSTATVDSNGDDGFKSGGRLSGGGGLGCGDVQQRRVEQGQGGLG